MLPVLYEFPEDIANDTADPPAWQDSSYWWMVTPNRDRSVTIKRLEDDWATGQGQRARRDNPLGVRSTSNMEIGLALRSDRWVGADLWQKAADKPHPGRADRAERGGGDRHRRRRPGRSAGPGGARARQDHQALAAVVEGMGASLRAGTAQGRGLGPPRLREQMATCKSSPAWATTSPRSLRGPAHRQSGTLGSVGLDPLGVGAIVDALAEVGIAGNDRVVGITQGWKPTGAIKTAERKLADGTLRHGGSGLMAWAVGNAKVEPRGNAIAITKQASGSAKIDPLMAAFNAVALMAMNPKPVGRSYPRSDEMMAP